MSVNRILAIFEKDLKDFFKNTTIVFMPVIPIFLAFLYDRMGETGEELPLFMIFIIVGAVFSCVSSGCMMMFMAEENEKQTLRGLTMSPASFADIIIGKSLLTFVLTVVSLLLSLMFVGFDNMVKLNLIISLILLFFFFLFLGIGIGLFVKTVGMTTVYMMPIMFIFGFTPMFWLFGFEEGDTALKVADKFPIMLSLEASEDSSWLPILWLTFWVLGALLFMYICFVRMKTDD